MPAIANPTLRVEVATAAALRKDTKGALEWLERARTRPGTATTDFIERDPIFRAQLGTDSPLSRDIVDRMRRDVEGQRERARQRGPASDGGTAGAADCRNAA